MGRSPEWHLIPHKPHAPRTSTYLPHDIAPVPVWVDECEGHPAVAAARLSVHLQSAAGGNDQKKGLRVPPHGSQRWAGVVLRKGLRVLQNKGLRVLQHSGLRVLPEGNQQ